MNHCEDPNRPPVGAEAGFLYMYLSMYICDDHAAIPCFNIPVKRFRIHHAMATVATTKSGMQVDPHSPFEMFTQMCCRWILTAK